MIVIEIKTIHSLRNSSKGKLISNRRFGVIVSTKIATKIFRPENIVRKDFCHDIFCSFLVLSGNLVSNIIIRKPTEAKKSFQEAPKKIWKLSGQKSLQYFRCYFGRTDGTKKTFQNMYWPSIDITLSDLTLLFFNDFRIKQFY